MRLTLAAAALVVASGAAFAQGTSTSTGTPPASTTAPSTMPGTTMGATPNSTTGVAPGATTGTNRATVAPMGVPGGQTPSATVNTSPTATTPSPSAVQTTNTSHRTAAAPVPGRNSFTQNQAARRIAAAGFTKVTGLKKDAQGIWRGQAEKDGNPTPVSLDYQGNVTGK